MRLGRIPRCGSFDFFLFEDHAVDQPPDERAVGDRAENVKTGVLLDKHRGDGDQNSERQHHPVEPALADARRVERCGVQRGGADDVHTGENVRVRVGGVDARDEPCGDVLALKHQRAQILPVRERDVKQHDRDEADADEGCEALEVLRVPKQQIHTHNGEQPVPETVGENEPFAERDHIVQRHVHGIIVACDNMLGNVKDDEIDHPDRDHPEMAVILDRSEPGLIVLFFTHDGYTPPDRSC